MGLGVCAGYFTCYGSVKLTSSLSWRAPFIIQAIFAFLLASFCTFLPTSPRWLILHGKRARALKEIDRLDISQVEAEKDILNVQHENTDAVSTIDGFFMIFKRNYRARTVLALFVLGMVQLCGIDGVLYVSRLAITTLLEPILSSNVGNGRMYTLIQSSTHLPSSPKPEYPPNLPLSSPAASQPYSCSPSPSQQSYTRIRWAVAIPSFSAG